MADPWALFIDDDDYTSHADADRIGVVSRASAQTGVLSAVIRDEASNLPIATDQEVQLVALRPQGGNTTLAASASIGAVNVKVVSVTGFAAGDEIVVGSHPTAELRTISSVGTAGAGGTGITFSPALAVAHASGQQVYDAERLFAGTIRRRIGTQDGSARVHRITARDYSDLLAQDVIDVSFRSVDESDKARVEWLVTTWGAKGVTVGAEVQQTLAQMPLGEDGSSEQEFSGKTLDGAIRQVEAITGAVHYVDFVKKLHYYLAESNSAPFALSDAPDSVSTWPYHLLSLPEDSASTVNAVYVFGAELETGQIRGWRPDPPPAASIRRAAVIRDSSITSTAQRDAVGDAYLAANSDPIVDGSLRTHRSGFRAGQTFQLTNAAWGLVSVTYVIHEVVTAIEAGIPIFTILFGSTPADLASVLGGNARASASAIASAESALGQVRAMADLSVAGANLLPDSSFESSGGWSVGAGWIVGYNPTHPDTAAHGEKVARLELSGAAASSGELVSI